MKITAVVGTNRKKYTYQIIKLFEEEFNKKEKIDFEYIFLSDYDLKFCKGCGICKEDETLCTINDDSLVIKDLLINSELIIFASPVYENFISGIFKNFIDRFHYLSFRNLLNRKFSIVLSTSSFTGLYNTLNYMHFFSVLCGMNNVGRLGVLIPKYSNDKYKNIIRNRIKKIVSNYYLIKDKIVKPDIFDLLIFKDQKDRIIKIKDKYPKAYEYWKQNGWLTQSYYYNVKINPAKWILLKILKLSLSRN